jgi:L-ribulose-5-phosphate 3-epimerase UlaE
MPRFDFLELAMDEGDEEEGKSPWMREMKKRVDHDAVDATWGELTQLKGSIPTFQARG